MPIYLYKNPETGEIKEVIQGMNEIHEYHEGNVMWNRVFTVPTHATDMRVPTSREEFMDITSRKKGTLGDMQDLSREMSEKRASQSLEGIDPVKQKYFEEYSKKRRGRKHQMDKKPIEKKGIKVHFD